MKKHYFIIVAFVLCLVFSAGADATIIGDFYFYGEAGGATAEAWMTVTIAGNQLVAEIENTSPDYIDSSGTYYSPAIVGFGFDLDFEGGETTSNILDWDLRAYEKDADGNISDDAVYIGGMDGSPPNTGDWVLSLNQYQGINVDYIPNTDRGLNGALYNPDALGPGANTSYYTTATLNMAFEFNISAFVLNKEDSNYYSPFMKFQRLGSGDESLKLPDPEPEVTTPEPATLFILGSGLLGLAFRQRR